MKIQPILRQASALVLGCVLTLSAWAQNGDKPASPTMTATGKVGAATITVNYASPAVKGRAIWGKLVPYGEVWRTGANAATTFETDKAIKVEGKSLPAGKYALFTIPTDSVWTVIFNKTHDQWGAYDYKADQDALRVTVKPKKAAKLNERLIIAVNAKGLLISWENLEIPVSIQ